MLFLTLLVCSLAWGQDTQTLSAETTPVAQDAAVAAETLDPIDLELTQRLLGDVTQEGL